MHYILYCSKCYGDWICHLSIPETLHDMPRYTFLLPFICVTSSGLSFILIFHTLIFDFSFLPFHLFHHCLILPPSWQKKLSLLHLLPVSNFFVIRDTLSAMLFHAWVVNANTENSFIKTYFVKVSPRWKQHGP